MKSTYKFFLLAVMLTASLSSCKKYLEEYNPGGSTIETYYNTSQGFEDLIKGNYSSLRPILNYPGLYFLGTDVFTIFDPQAVNDLNNYGTNLNSNNPDVDSFWKQLYYAINLTNTSLYWADQVSGMDATLLEIRRGEAKALRAFYYFLLTETFGDVPLVVQPVTEPAFDYTRSSEEAIYQQIIQDLTEAIEQLPKKGESGYEEGRVSEGMAAHLLAKVYLTRAYKSYGAGQEDFRQAAAYAEQVINGGYSLLNKYGNLFDPTITNFQVNSESIFSVQYSTVANSNTYTFITAPTVAVTGNGLHNLFLMDMSTYPAIGRSSYYNKSTSLVAPNSFFFQLFNKKQDSRYQSSLHTAILAQVAPSVSNTGFALGDTVVYFPDEPWTAEQKKQVPYYVYNPNEYAVRTNFAVRSFPSFKKFREVNIAYNDNGGTRDTYVFRLAETYLIAAEAYLEMGDQAKALEHFNKVRTRAATEGVDAASGKTYAELMTATSLTIDTILDERARELAGEELRWLELKRGGRLVDRVLENNEEAARVNAIDDHHLLRPIPQSQIDLNRTAFPQNGGY